MVIRFRSYIADNMGRSLIILFAPDLNTISGGVQAAGNIDLNCTGPGFIETHINTVFCIHIAADVQQCVTVQHSVIVVYPVPII